MKLQIKQRGKKKKAHSVCVCAILVSSVELQGAMVFSLWSSQLSYCSVKQYDSAFYSVVVGVPCDSSSLGKD